MVSGSHVPGDHARFLADASHALASSLDYQTTLTTVAHQAIPAIADCCMIYLLEEDGSVQRAAMAHRDPRRQAMMAEILARYPVSLEARKGTSRVLRSGRSEVVADIPDSMLIELARDDRHLAFLRDERLRSMMSVPLFTRGRTIGAITLLSNRPDRRYGIDDLTLAEELARRAALAVDNARLYRAACDARAAAEEALDAQQRSERLLAAVLDHTPALIAIKDLAGRYLLVNRRFDMLFGGKRGPVIGARDRDLFPLEVERALRADHERVLAGHIPLEVEESLPLDVGERTYLSIKFPLLDEAGVPHAVCTISTDVTERRQLEEQLSHSNKMEALGRLAGGIAHDFNNILTSLRGYSETLLEGLGASPLRRFAERIHKSASRASALSERLLGFCRTRELRTEVVDLNEIVGGLESMLEHALVGIRLVTQLDDHPALVEADAGELEQLVLNLALNARDALGDGGEIRITTEHRRIDGEPHIILTIADTGHGMDAATRERVFEPFFTTKDLGRGTGLGLFTVYATVQRCRGHIAVRSQPGLGTVFEVQLPQSRAAWIAEPRGREAAAGGGTILVVDDDHDVRMLIGDVLEYGGYQVLAASDGAVALDVVDHHPGPIDLLVTDVVMPELNGCELARQLRRRRPELRVLFVSGYSGDILDRYGVSPESVLPKPYSIDVLRQRVRQALE
jgi:PAS domain S-box-containing protein